MKKLVLLACISLGCAAQSSAQLTLLPKAGVNISNVRYENDEALGGQKPRVGLTLGLGVNIPQTSIFSFQTEVLYTSKGFSAKNDGLADYEGWYSLNYLEVPMLAKATFGTKRLGVYGNGGLSFSYLLGGRVKGQYDIVNLLRDDIDERLEFTDEPNPLLLHEVDANRIDVGLNLGGGINFSAGMLPLFIDLRCNMGMIDHDKDQASKNLTFAITLGSQIGF